MLLALYFVFKDTPPTDIYTLSLHDALPILAPRPSRADLVALASGIRRVVFAVLVLVGQDRKSTRLNSSHPSISYAVFCLKKKRLYVHPTPYRPRDDAR